MHLRSLINDFELINEDFLFSGFDFINMLFKEGLEARAEWNKKQTLSSFL